MGGLLTVPIFDKWWQDEDDEEESILAGGVCKVIMVLSLWNENLRDCSLRLF
jgi:hypothetical protein